MNELQQCRSLFSKGLDADEAGNKLEAIELYSQAVELCIKTQCDDPETKDKLKQLASQALDRAEELKGIHKTTATSRSLPLSPSTSSGLPVRSCPKTSEMVDVSDPTRPGLHRGSSAHLKLASGKDTYSEDEKCVLANTSHINNNLYLPFMRQDINEIFTFPMPFSDKAGHLILSPKQRRDFYRWARLSELHPEPRIVSGHRVNYLTIKQTVVSDCSFVASLAVAAYYEQRFEKKLITSIIYPRNKQDEPRYNPDGKYMIKLHINGISRKVIIDDELPLGHGNRLLCSYSSNSDEFWISLLEKAYMKVMGGYDFPGSNSNIDLHALTGWIPERAAIRPDEVDFNADALFDKICNGLFRGNVLVTVATGEMDEDTEKRTGLVGTHAYAVLEAVKADNTQLLKLKNPWSHLRWRGNYSELDQVHWTQQLQDTLHYDPTQAAIHDNGVFWIDYPSMCKFFDVFYLNWNPSLFKYTYCIHQQWHAGVGPVKDAYSIGDNPQFSLHVEQGSGAVWVLLTRHITDIDDFRENKEYITLLVYNNDGKRVYYPHSPPPFIDGVRINSPHYLCKVKLDPERSRKYSLVVSQYEKTATIYYTLRAYSSSEFKLAKIEPFPYVCPNVNGEWKGVTAGGCGNHPATYMNNPRYRLELSNRSTHHLLLELRAPKDYQVALEVFPKKMEDDSVTAPFVSKSSGPYRSGFVAFDLEDLPSGIYEVMPSTYYPNQESPFILTVKCTSKVKIYKRSDQEWAPVS